jgi:hypothetical protein
MGGWSAPRYHGDKQKGSVFVPHDYVLRQKGAFPYYSCTLVCPAT